MADLDATAGLAFRVGPVREFEDAQRATSADATPLKPATANTLRAQLPKLPDPATLQMSSSADFAGRFFSAPAIIAQTTGEDAPSATQASKPPEPFELVGNNCTEERPCKMRSNLGLKFNRPIQARDSFEGLIEVEPTIEDLQFIRKRHQSKELEILGQIQPGTTYKVAISPDITDESGQALGKEVERSFYIRDAQPSLNASGSIMGLLDRDLDGHFPFFSINIDRLRVRAYQVEAQDWASYFEFLRSHERARSAAMMRHPTDVEAPAPLGKLAIDKTLEVDGVFNTFDTHHIDLRDALNEHGHGQILLMIEPIGVKARPLTIWLQATDLNLNAVRAEDQLLVRAQSRVDGREAEGVELSFLRGSKASETTDARGQATLMLPDAAHDRSARSPLNMLIARRGSDIALLPESPKGRSSRRPSTMPTAMRRTGAAEVIAWSRAKTTWVAKEPLDESPDAQTQPDYQLFTMDDRGAYRPGETVHIRGWIRSADERGGRLVVPPYRTIYYSVLGMPAPQTQSAPIAEDGSFKVDIEVPDNPNHIDMDYPEIAFYAVAGERSPYTHSLKILGASEAPWRLHATLPPYRGGQSITLGLHAAISEPARFGGAQSQWTLRANETDYRPAGLSAYRFGRVPAGSDGSKKYVKFQPELQTTQHDYRQRLDPIGTSQIALEFEHAEPPVPMQVEADIKVTDINQNVWPIKTEPFIVFPANSLVGLREPQEAFKVGETMRIAGVVADLGGMLRAGKTVEMNAVRMESLGPDKGAHVVEKSRQDCKWVSQKREKSCDFQAQAPGVWRITALTHDASGRPAMSQIFVEVHVDKRAREGARKSGVQKVEIHADKEQYEPGDTAHITINAPFEDAHGLAFILRDGGLSKVEFQVEGYAHSLDLPVGPEAFSGAAVFVELTATQNSPDASPVFLRASGAHGVLVAPPDPKLSVGLTALDGAKEKTTPRAFHLRVRDARGHLVPNSQVFLSVADRDFINRASPQLSSEHLYSLLGPKLGPLRISVQNTQDYIISTPAEDAPDIGSKTASFRDLVMASGSRIRNTKKAEAVKIAVKDETLADLWTRQDRQSSLLIRPRRYPINNTRPRGVDAPAIFKRAIHTDDNGEATIELPRPDTSTRFPLRAVAFHGVESIGQTDVHITLDAPLTLRPLLPDMVQAGAAFKVAVIVENHGDKAAAVELIARGANLELKDTNGQKLTVAPNAQATLHFEAVAGQPGEGIVQVGLRSGQHFIVERATTPVVGSASEPITR